MMRHSLHTGRDRRIGRRPIVAGAALALALMPAGAALAAPGGPTVRAATWSGSGPSKGQSPAIVGPLLQIFTFGVSFGLPTGCQLASSTIGAGAAELGQAGAVGPVIAAINNGCTTLQGQGMALIEQGQAMSRPLNVINPYVNPMIGQVADSFTKVGNDYGPALSPFGPTIAGLGGTINFFQGK